MKKYILISDLILGLLIVCTPFVLFPVCSNMKPDGTRMGCFYSGIFITVMGILIVVFSLLSLRKKFSVFSVIASACAGLMCWLVPYRIVNLEGNGWVCGLCLVEEHACRADTMPAVLVLISVLVILNILYMAINFVRPE